MIDGGLNALFQDHLPEFFWTRIETGGTCLGVPDLYFSSLGIDGWVETKGTDTPVKPSQIGWISKARRFHVRVFIAARFQCPAGPRRGAARDEIFLYSGDDVKTLAVTTWRSPERPKPIVWGEGGPARWPWARIGDVLIYK